MSDDSESRPKGGIAQQKRLDAKTKAMIYEGVSVSQLGLLFGQDNRTVAKRLATVLPCGTRAGFPIYSIAEAAPYLCKIPAEEIDRRIRTMNHEDLPPLLTKNYYAGKRERLRYEEETGNLWHTEDVLAHIAEAFKTCRTELLLLSDAVEREMALPERARSILKGLIDGCMENLRKSLTEGVEVKPEFDESTEGDDFDDISSEEDMFGGEEDTFHGL